MEKGIGGHHRAFRGRTNEWLTPPFILEALTKQPYGLFDLDPCACITQPWRTAETMYTINDDGFNKKWFGRVWLNPPYGKETGRWLNKLAEHRSGIALVFARTETKMFFDSVWSKASGIVFIEGRLYFHRPNGERGLTNAGGPSCLISYGELDSAILRNSIDKGLLKGKFLQIQN